MRFSTSLSVAQPTRTAQLPMIASNPIAVGNQVGGQALSCRRACGAWLNAGAAPVAVREEGEPVTCVIRLIGSARVTRNTHRRMLGLAVCESNYNSIL